MSNPTTPFSWQMPTSTDLVTDLPADFEVFGQAVATSMADLLGGTTGQVLAKNTNADMDFVWTAPTSGDITGVTAGTGISGGGTSGNVTVSIDTTVTVDKTTAQTLTNKTLTSPALTTPTISTATTNGDLLYGTGAGALTRLGIGTTGQSLTVAGGVPSWATPSAAAKSYSLINAGGTALTAASSITVSGISGKSDLFIVVVGMSSVNGTSTLNVQINGDTASNYQYAGPQIIGGSGYDSNNFLSDNANFTSIIRLGRTGSVQGIKVNAWLSISGANSSGVKPFSSAGGGDNNGGNSSYSYWLGGIWNNSATITEINFLSGNGNFDAGTVYIYGAA